MWINSDIFLWQSSALNQSSRDLRTIKLLSNPRVKLSRPKEGPINSPSFHNPPINHVPSPTRDSLKQDQIYPSNDNEQWARNLGIYLHFASFMAPLYPWPLIPIFNVKPIFLATCSTPLPERDRPRRGRKWGGDNSPRLWVAPRYLKSILLSPIHKTEVLIPLKLKRESNVEISPSRPYYFRIFFFCNTLGFWVLPKAWAPGSLNGLRIKSSSL